MTDLLWLSSLLKRKTEVWNNHTFCFVIMCYGVQMCKKREYYRIKQQDSKKGLNSSWMQCEKDLKTHRCEESVLWFMQWTQLHLSCFITQCIQLHASAWRLTMMPDAGGDEAWRDTHTHTQRSPSLKPRHHTDPRPVRTSSAVDKTTQVRYPQTTCCRISFLTVNAPNNKLNWCLSSSWMSPKRVTKL